MKLTTIAKQVLGRQTSNTINEGRVLRGVVDGKPTYIIEHDGQELRVNEKDWKAFKDMISLKESVVTEAVKEVVLSNEILDFLEERGILKGSDAQKVHKDLTAFLKEKGINESVVNEGKVDYDFSERELIRVLKQLKRGASTELDMIKAFERALGRKITYKELMAESIKEGLMGDIHALAQETSDVEDFITKFMADYGDIFAKNVGGFAGAKTPKLKKWLTDLYTDARS